MSLNPSMSVLVVDDTKLMISIVRGLLQHLGINDVDDANDGASALAKLRSKRYGLVISDWNMAPMSGYELLRELRNDPLLKRTPFILSLIHIYRRNRSANAQRLNAGITSLANQRS